MEKMAPLRRGHFELRPNYRVKRTGAHWLSAIVSHRALVCAKSSATLPFAHIALAISIGAYRT